mmetsp:Transcript_46524/g.132673  ORF Transcript_46524/g.132673 Transcript_46524/m.132673 type:complete len:230 (+) Transcript_46524:636-1325(+)
MRRFLRRTCRLCAMTTWYMGESTNRRSLMLMPWLPSTFSRQYPLTCGSVLRTRQKLAPGAQTDPPPDNVTFREFTRCSNAHLDRSGSGSTPGLHPSVPPKAQDFAGHRSRWRFQWSRPGPTSSPSSLKAVSLSVTRRLPGVTRNLCPRGKRTPMQGPASLSAARTAVVSSLFPSPDAPKSSGVTQRSSSQESRSDRCCVLMLSVPAMRPVNVRNLPKTAAAFARGLLAM